MRKRFFIILKKELDRFFSDWRMVINALVFPGIIFFLLYAFLMPHVLSLLNVSAAPFAVYAVNPPLAAESIFEQGGMKVTSIRESEKESVMKAIAGKSETFLLVFPEDFEDRLTVYNAQSDNRAPEIYIYFNSLAKGFTEQYGMLLSLLDAWETSMVNVFDINVSGGGDLAEADDRTGYFLSVLLPMFLIMFMFHGAMAVTIGAVTGEKERGTFACILVTPVSTRELASGKIFALGIETFLSGVSGTIGIILSMPRFIRYMEIGFASLNEQGAGRLTVNLSFYSLQDYGSLLLILLSAAYLIVASVALISICAKTSREAQMLLVPVIIALMSLSILSAVYGSSSVSHWYYSLIPFYNTIQILSGIFYRDYTSLQVFLPVLTNLLLAVLGTEILSKLLRNEKIMFNS